MSNSLLLISLLNSITFLCKYIQYKFLRKAGCVIKQNTFPRLMSILSTDVREEETTTEEMTTTTTEEKTTVEETTIHPPTPPLGIPPPPLPPPHETSWTGGEGGKWKNRKGKKEKKQGGGKWKGQKAKKSKKQQNAGWRL